MRILTILFAIVLVVASFALAYRYNNDALSARKNLNKERYMRMETEDSLQKVTTKANSLEGELLRTKKKLTLIENSMDQIKGVNTDLKERLEQANQVKESLEKKLQALTATAASAGSN